MSAPSNSTSTGNADPEQEMENPNISVTAIGGSASVKPTAADKTVTGNKRKRGAGNAKDKATDKGLNLTVRYALPFWWIINNIRLELEGGGDA